MIGRQSTEESAAGPDVLVEAYRRVVEIDAALTKAPTVDPELHRWCEQRLGELLDLLEPYAERAAAGPEGSANE